MTQKNAAFAAGQIIVASAFYLVNYGLIWYLLGTESLGLWSIIASVTNIGNIAYLGFSSSVVNFTAQYTARGDTNALNALVRNNLIVVGGLTLIFCLGIYAFTPRLYSDSLQTVEAAYFAEVLVLNLTGMALASLSSSFMALLEGVQRSYVKSLILTAGALLNTLTVAMLVRPLGLKGVAVGYLLSGLFILLLSAAQARRNLPTLAVWPLRWDRAQFRQTSVFGAKAQGIAVLQLLFDPMTKYLLSRFASLEFIAYFEVANKLVMQARMVVLTGLQVLVPKVAATLHNTEGFVVSQHRLLVTLAAPGTAIALSWVWIGGEFVIQIWTDTSTQTTVNCLQILALGWGVNVVTLPAYFLLWGTGMLRINLINQVLLAVFNILLALPLGYYSGGLGVVWGWSGAAALSSVYTFWAFWRRFNVPLGQLWFLVQLGLSTLILLILLEFWQQTEDEQSWIGYAGLLALCTGTLVLLAQNQLRMLRSSAASSSVEETPTNV